MSSLYVYRAKVERVVDGDTFDVFIDAGFHLTYATRVRLHGYDTPERYRGSSLERAKAAEATDAAQAWLDSRADDLLVRTHKSDSFGRWLAEVFVPMANGSGEGGEDHLGLHLAARGLASEWPNRWRELYDDTTGGSP